MTRSTRHQDLPKRKRNLPADFRTDPAYDAEVDERGYYKCEKGRCSKAPYYTRSNQAFKIHTDKHIKPYKCPYGCQDYSQLNSYTEHERKSHLCPEDGCVLGQLGSGVSGIVEWRLHMKKSHGKEIKGSCQNCNKHQFLCDGVLPCSLCVSKDAVCRYLNDKKRPASTEGMELSEDQSKIKSSEHKAGSRSTKKARNDRGQSESTPDATHKYVGDSSEHLEERFSGQQDDNITLKRATDESHRRDDDGNIFNAYGVTAWFAPPHAALIYLADHPKQMLLNDVHPEAVSSDLRKIRRGSIEPERLITFLNNSSCYNSGSSRGAIYWQHIVSFCVATMRVESESLQNASALTLFFRPPRPATVLLHEHTVQLVRQNEAACKKDSGLVATLGRETEVSSLVGLLHVAKLASGSLSKPLQDLLTCLEVTMKFEFKAKEAYQSHEPPSDIALPQPTRFQQTMDTEFPLSGIFGDKQMEFAPKHRQLLPPTEGDTPQMSTDSGFDTNRQDLLAILRADYTFP